jgi:hypothetical protein
LVLLLLLLQGAAALKRYSCLTMVDELIVDEPMPKGMAYKE